MSDVLSFTKRMVRVDSRLPAEGPLAQLVADEIRSIGLEPVWQEVSPGRPNVYVIVKAGPKSGLVTFTGHLDTVDAAEGWETDPLDPVERDGKLYGLGALDMKSGIACAFHAFRRLIQDPALASRLGTLAFAATVDEEAFGTGSRALLETPLGKSDLLFLTESFYGGSEATDLVIPIAQPGKILYRVVVTGRTSHALLSPERGINAVHDASKIVAALDRLPLGSHHLIGPMNYSTLKIDGGYREYSVIVPERCEIIITRLLAPGETQAKALDELRTLIAGLGLESTVTVEAAPPSYEPFELDPAHPGMAAFEAAYQARLGVAPRLGGTLVITDGNVYLGEGGIPTVTFGPRGTGFHEKNEYVEVATLEPVVDVLVDATVRYFDGRP